MNKNFELINDVRNRINEELKKIISVETELDLKKNQGRVIKFYDGIGAIEGLSDARVGQKIIFKTSSERAMQFSKESMEIFGEIMDIEHNLVECIVFGEERFIKEGDIVELDETKDTLSIKISDNILGKVIDPFCRLIDLYSLNDELLVEKHHNNTNDEQAVVLPIEREATPISSRASINKPLQTGIKIIDTAIPIGLGQRMLVIGDRGTGKTTIALTIIKNMQNQHNSENKVFIYTAIAKKVSEIKKIYEKLCEYHKNIIIVLTKANDPASLVYLAPYSATTIAEYFRDKGKDVVIIYDDLTAHANAYRHISLLLERPPGREAYPGDIFYLHSRLLERASNIYFDPSNNTISNFKTYKTNKSLNNNKIKTSSITAIPLVQTNESDFSAYIPTNIISITDGQIYLDTELANNKIMPAINVGLSVSRIGSKAQNPLVAEISKSIKTDISRYFEKKKYSTFGFELNDDDKSIISLGESILKFSNQDELQTFSEKELILQLLSIYHNNEKEKSNEIIDSFLNKFIQKFKDNEEAYKLSGFENENDFLNQLKSYITY